MKPAPGNSQIANRTSKIAFIALGSNLGNSQAILRQALNRLEDFSDFPLMKSSLWQTEPVACPPGSPPFINAVIGLMPRAGETPESLLEKLKALEKEFGRRPKKILNEPRPLDLDLIAFGTQVCATPRLTVPHARALQRRFVLEPWSEIAPDLVPPGQAQTVSQLLAKLVSSELVRRLE